MRLALTVPGVLHTEKSPSQIDTEKALHSFRVNTLGPLLLLKHLAPFLPTRSTSAFKADGCLPAPHAIYAMMAARVGSISDNRLGGWYSYRASKAGVFQLAKTFDAYLQAQSGHRAMAVALHPGTVRTEFTRAFWDGGQREMLEPDDAAAKLLAVLCNLSVAAGRGRCLDWRGEEVVP
jgi:NAD(P)-dependent dehydrogenase (short-subunit alcohol dehydrogenase family)